MDKVPERVAQAELLDEQGGSPKASDMWAQRPAYPIRCHCG